MFKKAFCSIILLFTATGLLYADSFSFKAAVDKSTVPLNESFTYSITVSGDGKNLPEHQINAMPEFTIYGTSVSQVRSIDNDKAYMSVTYKYTLGPKRTGKCKIPSAKVTFNGRTYLTESIEVKVTPVKSVGSQKVKNISSLGSRKSASNSNGKAFISTSVNKKTVYENEKLVYKVSFYTNLDLVVNIEYYLPDFSGFWNDGSKHKKGHFQVIDGSNYHINEIETVLYPVGAGLKTITPTNLKIAVMDFSSPDARDDFFNIFANVGRGQTKILETETIEVKVLPLPQEDRPYDFSGAVGDFKIKSSVDKTDAKTNEPVTLTVTVSGNGNMKSISDIKFNSYDGFRKYDTIVANTSDNSKEFKTIFIPLMPGEKEIPSASLSFFNPVKKQYETVKTQSLKITISGEPVYSKDSTENASKISKVKNDINYNKQIKELKLYKGHFVKKPIFYLIFTPFILLLFFSICYRLYVNRIRGNKFKNLKSSHFVNFHKLISEAETSIAIDSLNIALSKIHQALIEFINMKTGILSDNLQELQIADSLTKSGVDNETVSTILKVLERINFYKFASVRLEKDSLSALLREIDAIVINLKK